MRERRWFVLEEREGWVERPRRDTNVMMMFPFRERRWFVLEGEGG